MKQSIGVKTRIGFVSHKDMYANGKIYRLSVKMLFPDGPNKLGYPARDSSEQFVYALPGGGSFVPKDLLFAEEMVHARSTVYAYSLHDQQE